MCWEVQSGHLPPLPQETVFPPKTIVAHTPGLLHTYIIGLILTSHLQTTFSTYVINFYSVHCTILLSLHATSPLHRTPSQTHSSVRHAGISPPCPYGIPRSYTHPPATPHTHTLYMYDLISSSSHRTLNTHCLLFCCTLVLPLLPRLPTQGNRCRHPSPHYFLVFRLHLNLSFYNHLMLWAIQAPRELQHCSPGASYDQYPGTQAHTI